MKKKYTEFAQKVSSLHLHFRRGLTNFEDRKLFACLQDSYSEWISFRQLFESDRVSRENLKFAYVSEQNQIKSLRQFFLPRNYIRTKEVYSLYSKIKDDDSTVSLTFIY